MSRMNTHTRASVSLLGEIETRISICVWLFAFCQASHALSSVLLSFLFLLSFSLLLIHLSPALSLSLSLSRKNFHACRLSAPHACLPGHRRYSTKTPIYVPIESSFADKKQLLTAYSMLLFLPPHRFGFSRRFVDLSRESATRICFFNSLTRHHQIDSLIC